MKGGNAMKQHELEMKIKESDELRARAMKMAEESNALMDVDFKKSNEMFIESIDLWQKGCAIFNQVTEWRMNEEVKPDSNENLSAKVGQDAKSTEHLVIDYLNKDQLHHLGIAVNEKLGRVFWSEIAEYNNVTFRNFPTITTDDTEFRNCVFEDIQSIEFSNGCVKNCTFCNVSEINGHYTDFKNCTFIQCCSQGPLLTIDSEGQVDGCTFETITALGEDGYVIFSVYGKKTEVQDIRNCRFVDCMTESADGALTSCCYFKPFSSHKTIDIDNIDYESCVFDELNSQS